MYCRRQPLWNCRTVLRLGSARTQAVQITGSEPHALCRFQPAMMVAPASSHKQVFHLETSQLVTYESMRRFKRSCLPDSLLVLRNKRDEESAEHFIYACLLKVKQLSGRQERLNASTAPTRSASATASLPVSASASANVSVS